MVNKIKRKKSILFSKKGMSLIELMAAVGIMSILGSVFMTMITDLVKSKKHIEQKDEMLVIYQDFIELSKDKEMCSSNFYNISLNRPTSTAGATTTLIGLGGKINSGIIYQGYKYNGAGEKDVTGTFQANTPIIAQYNHPNPIQGVKVNKVEIKLSNKQSTKKEFIYKGTGYIKWIAKLIIELEKENSNFSLSKFKKELSFNIVTDKINNKVFQCYGGQTISEDILAQFCDDIGGTYDITKDPKCSLNHANVGAHTEEEGIGLYYNSTSNISDGSLTDEIFRMNKDFFSFSPDGSASSSPTNSFYMNAGSFSLTSDSGVFGSDGNNLIHEYFQYDDLSATSCRSFQYISGKVVCSAVPMTVVDTLSVQNCIALGGGCPSGGEICIGDDCRNDFQVQECEGSSVIMGIKETGEVICSQSINCPSNTYFAGLNSDGSVVCRPIPTKTCDTNHYISEIKKINGDEDVIICKKLPNTLLNKKCSSPNYYLTKVQGSTISCQIDIYAGRQNPPPGMKAPVLIGFTGGTRTTSATAQYKSFSDILDLYGAIDARTYLWAVEGPGFKDSHYDRWEDMGVW